MSDNAMSSATVDAADSVPATGKHASRFQKGNPGFGLRKGAAVRDSVKVPSLLKAMREVMLRSESKDRTQLQKECRLWLKENRTQFLGKLADMERAHLMALAKGKPAEKADDQPRPERDEASERVEDLIDSLLSDLGVKA